MEMGDNAKKIFNDLSGGSRPLDIFVFEGTVIAGLNGIEPFNMFSDRPMKDWVKELAEPGPERSSRSAIAPAGAASLLTAQIPVRDNIGLQYPQTQARRFPGGGFSIKMGNLPVIAVSPDARLTRIG